MLFFSFWATKTLSVSKHRNIQCFKAQTFPTSKIFSVSFQEVFQRLSLEIGIGKVGVGRRVPNKCLKFYWVDEVVFSLYYLRYSCTNIIWIGSFDLLQINSSRMRDTISKIEFESVSTYGQLLNSRLYFIVDQIILNPWGPRKPSCAGLLFSHWPRFQVVNEGSFIGMKQSN